MAAASTTAMNTNKSENNAEEDSDEVIYDLTTDFRAASRALATPTPALRSSAVQTPTPFEDERPKSRNVSVQTTLPKSQCCKKHKQHRVKHESSKNGEKVPQMLTVERIWTPYLGDYANPRDATEIPPELPARPKSGLARPKSALSTKSTVKMQPKKAKVVTPLEQQHQKITEKSSKSAKTSTNKNTMSSKFSPMFKPCMNVNQRRVIKYNFLLSVAINVLILALGGTGFISVLSTEFKRDANYQYVLITASFSVCYALLCLMTDALGLLGLHRRNRELLLPWMLWYILDMAIYVSLMVLVIVFMDNYLILLVIFKIIWTLFVWVNVRDLYTSGKIYGGSLRKKFKSDILY